MSKKTASFVFRSFSAVMLLTLLVGALGVTPARAASWVVTKTADTNDGVCGADCSLREAIAAAAPGDTITFDGDYTILLASQLTIAKNLTIDGAGHSVTVDGQHSVRVFSVNSGVAFNLNHLTVANGASTDPDGGGGIYNQGTLNVTNSTLSGNSANGGGGGGGISNYGTLNVVNSTLSGNSDDGGGGGIYNPTGSTLTVTNSTLSGNSALYGGGIFNRGTLTVTNSTFSGNSASAGGGISNWGTLNVTNSTFSDNSADYYGGGIFNVTGSTLTVTNSTLSGNSALNGGGIFNQGTLNVMNSTFSGNSAPAGAGGGIYSENTVPTIKNTLIVNSPTGGNCTGAIGGASNLADDATCGTGFTHSSPILLGALGNYGGPTETFPLLTGSPAIGAGNPATCAAAPVSGKDQRGIQRGASCDIGAYEVETAQTVSPFIVNTAADHSIGGICSTDDCTLREAIAAAAPGDTITFGGDYTITLGSQLVIGNDLTIDGSGHQITVSGNNATRVFNITGGHVTLNALNILHGSVSGTSGGGIWNSGVLTLTRSTLSGNAATYAGAGVYNASGASLTIINSTFADNHGGAEGSGVTNYGTLAVTNATFSGNGGR